MKSDHRILTYLQAVDALCYNDFSIKIPTGDDDIGKLGEAIQHLRSLLQRQWEHNRTLNTMMADNILNLWLNQVLDHLYESCTALIPYDRISLALPGEDNSI